ncbi:MAG: DUF1565 domain-containing protein [Bacteroidales bacterium]|nr:DUF1565 domain-containing protein [Bacteroidales bacterium]
MTKRLTLWISVLMMTGTAFAQLPGKLSNAVNTAKNTAKTIATPVKEENSPATLTHKTAPSNTAVTLRSTVAQGPTYYVSSTTGSNRNDGSQNAPFKNLQKALDVAESGATIRVAEGNYYGMLNSGNIIISKPVSIIGGYAANFSERDIRKHPTLIQPSAASNGSAQGMGTIQLKSIVAPDQTVLIDGLIMDRGYSISYNRDGKGKPEGVESPMMNPIGVKGIGGENFTEDVLTTETAMIYFDGYQGVVNSVHVVIRNCAFLNCPNFGILGMLKGGSLTVDNSLFVNVRMATLDVRGADIKSVIPITFTNNTVLFVWSRLRDLEDMGYGYRMIPGTSNTICNNIFGCAVFSALDRTHVDSDKAREAMRKEVVKNNIFFLNRRTDLTLPGGGMFLRVRAQDFEDVEQLAEVSGNRSLSDPAVFQGKIDKAYLEGFINLQSTQTVSVDYNSSVNQFRSAFGMNLQGTGSTTANMYANRYPWQEALQLFGAVNACGAQLPK